jgi:hypothetical protein
MPLRLAEGPANRDDVRISNLDGNGAHAPLVSERVAHPRRHIPGRPRLLPRAGVVPWWLEAFDSHERIQPTGQRSPGSHIRCRDVDGREIVCGKSGQQDVRRSRQVSNASTLENPLGVIADATPTRRGRKQPPPRWFGDGFSLVRNRGCPHRSSPMAPKSTLSCLCVIKLGLLPVAWPRQRGGEVSTSDQAMARAAERLRLKSIPRAWERAVSCAAVWLPAAARLVELRSNFGRA